MDLRLDEQMDMIQERRQQPIHCKTQVLSRNQSYFPHSVFSF